MQTYKSAVKLTPEIISEQLRIAALPFDRFPEKPQLILCIALTAISILLLALDSCPSGWKTIAVVVLFVDYFLFVCPLLFHAIFHLQLKINEKLYGTPSPTCETWLEDSKIVERIVETGAIKRKTLTYSKVYPTENYIFISLGGYIFTFAKADFTESELSELLQFLRRHCDSIVQ